MYLRENNPRTVEFFGFDWQFRLDGESSYRPVQLPHDWSVEYPFDEKSPTYGSGGYVKAGVGWYRKQFKVCADRKGKRVFIQFDGAYMCAKVMLNSKELGEHVYGYTPFEFEITDIVNYEEENELIVRVDNSHQPNSRWYSGSGITRDVWLKCVNQEHIPIYGTYITTNIVSDKTAEITVVTTVEPREAKDLTLATIILDQNGVERAKAESAVSQPGEIKQVITLTDTNLWSAETPYLYKAVSVLKRGESITDEYETVFGVRSVEFDADKGCIINGKQVKLNGVCLHHDGGSVGAAVPKKLWKRRLATLKEMGCNAIRCAHNPPDPALLELCDEMGFYVMDEAFDEWVYLKRKEHGSNTHESHGYSEWFKEYHVADLEAMLYRDRNHPSVIIWSIGNEVPEQSSPEGHLIAKELQDICHRIDPTRLCTQANDQIYAEPRRTTEEFLNTLDIVGYNYAGRWRTRAETLYFDDKLANPDRLIIGTENTSAGGVRGEYNMGMGERGWRRPYYNAPVNVDRLLRYTMTHDFVSGDFMWTGIDHLGESHWPNRSASCGVMDTCGFPKNHYYFYQSIWNREKPMLHLFPHRNLDIEEGVIIPVLCYTNCTYVELFVDGKSYGRKASSYPQYGMTERWAHFDKPPVIASTNDMFLSWDVPFSGAVMEAVGYIDGGEVCRKEVKSAGKPAKIRAIPDTNTVAADGRDIVHIEIAITDSNSAVNPVAVNSVTVKVEGAAELIGIDNGKPDCHDSFKGDTMSVHAGLMLAIIRAKRKKGRITVTIASEGLDEAVLELNAK